MATVIERSGGRYEVQDVEFGQVYKWCPECVVVECDCGEVTILIPSVPTCQCGADHTALVRGELVARQSGDKALHPWRYAGEREGLGIPF
ncbi:MAG: hypothetical protein QOI57_841 [Rubrobacteraceae bacterium]|jgi:hypothetical protein|nr:hypothetical protein [Rubrobacteraceae bacterium]